MLLSAHLDRLAIGFDEDACSRDKELSEVRKANRSLQLEVNELNERIRVLEADVASVKKRDEEWSSKLAKASSRHAKDKGKITSLN